MLTDLAGLAAHAGETLGTTGWRAFTQDDVNAFADLTDDHNFIHVDPEAAARTPFGGTIAHGYFTLAMLAPISFELLQISDLGMGVNYGLDKVRFPAPVPVGARFRGTAVLDDVAEVAGGQQAKVTITIEVEDTPKPAVVAECLLRYYAS
jgi:acyl dehydratase